MSPSASTTSFRGGAPASSLARSYVYKNPARRQFVLEVDFDLLNLPTLPDRMVESLTRHLVTRLGEAADRVIQQAQARLKPGHGYDTGLMHDTLVSRLGVVFEAVFYDLLSDQADYWTYVEFGHWMRNGQWWEGYHFLEDSVIENEAYIRSKVVEAYRDTVQDLAIEARVPPAMRGILRAA